MARLPNGLAWDDVELIRMLTGRDDGCFDQLKQKMSFDKISIFQLFLKNKIDYHVPDVIQLFFL